MMEFTEGDTVSYKVEECGRPFFLRGRIEMGIVQNDKGYGKMMIILNDSNLDECSDYMKARTMNMFNAFYENFKYSKIVLTEKKVTFHV